ncbi:AMP-binding protein [Nocardioides sp. W7]|uniref:AMP-binding protein n=1 Tax=Nocardioides sp. W7 TaxID=2931390 RepID=UPI001FD235DE|nr:AMP-binding protein [Nocardioides sp. W7]
MSSITRVEPAPSVVTVADLLLARAADSHLGLRTRERDWTWAEVVAESIARTGLARELISAGPPHIGVYLDNDPEYLLWVGAAALGGFAIVGLNKTRRTEQLDDEIRRTDCRIVVTDRAGLARLPLPELEAGGVRVLVVGEADYAAKLAPHRGTPLPVSGSVDPDRLLLLLFTSGTTGRSKAVRCSQGRLAQRGLAASRRDGVGRDDVCLACMPLFHGNALMALWAPALAVGATVVLTGKFSASRFIDDVRDFGVTYFTYVGKAIAYVLATPERADDLDNELVRAFGTEASSHDRHRFRERFGCELIEGYGSTESSGLVLRDPAAPETALGRPAPQVAVIDPETLEECPRAVVDATGRVLNPEQAVGEIVDRAGAASFEGYYNDPEATAARLHHGWVWTGDLGYVDEGGFLHFGGRRGDWLRVDGENISALTVERIVERHPDVVSAAAFGIPDARSGDALMIAVQLAEGRSFDGEDFLAYLAAQPDLGAKELPLFVRVAEQLPTTGSNKVVKAPLVATAWCCDDRVFWRAGREAREYREFGPQDRAALSAEFARHERGHLLPLAPV